MVFVIICFQVYGVVNNLSDEWLVICGIFFGVINKICFGFLVVKKILRILSKLIFDY